MLHRSAGGGVHAKELPQNNTVKQTTSHGWGLRLGRPGTMMELGNLGNLVPMFPNAARKWDRNQDRIDDVGHTGPPSKV